jgi:flavin-dependent dehydrogenase
MNCDYDVIVVGARVAGASTAMLLGRQGHRVLLIDRAELPSDTLSTHAILRSGILQLTRWGLLDRVVAAGTPGVKDITLGFGEERLEFQVRAEYGVGTLYAPRRHILDGIILEAAREAGADFLGSVRMVDLIRDRGDSVHGILLDRGGGQVEPVTARMVVGADGVWSRTAELVGATAYRSHQPTNAVHYAYFQGVTSEGFRFQFTPGVNAGIIPTNDGMSCVFVGRHRDRLGDFRADPDGEFDRLLASAGRDLADLVGHGTRATPFRGTPGLPGFIRRPWGRGWALVGDAGYTKDPISAHGISDALRDAELCARAIDRALTEPGSASRVLRRYQDQRDSLSVRMFAESEALAGYRWDATEASTRMRVVSEAVRTECAFLEAMPEWTPVLSAV